MLPILAAHSFSKCKEAYTMKVTLIQNQNTEYVIVIPKDAKPVEQTAAKELQTYLKKALGAELPIENEQCGIRKAFYIGHTDYAKDAGITGASTENWIIRLYEENVILTGGVKANDRGILYAVYHFLEDIVGIRWWSVWEEYVPNLTELALESDFIKEGTPAFPYRKVLSYRQMKDFYYDARTRGNVVGDDGLENGAYHPNIKQLGGALQMGRPHHVHTLDKYFPPDKYFPAHPEWYAWSDSEGKRISYGLCCLTNEEFINALLEKLMAYIEEDQALAAKTGVEPPCFYSISFPDDTTFCDCPKCKALLEKAGSSGYALQFVNRIAKAVAEKYPDVKIETLVYMNYLEPPKDDTIPEKNVTIRLAQVYVDIIHSIYDKGNQWYLRLLKAWSEICKKAGCTFYVWEYMYNVFFDLPTPIAYRLSDTFRAFYEAGITGIFVENECLSADMWELTQYMLVHLCEDPYADEEALIDDFITHFYGPAAEYVKAYLLELKRSATEHNYSVFCIVESVHFNYLDAAAVKKGMLLLEKAMEAVNGDPVYAPRIQYMQTLLQASLLIKYFDLKKMAEQAGESFAFDRKVILQNVLTGLEAAKQLPRIGAESVRIQREIRYFENYAIADEEFAPLPEELSNADPKDVYQFYFKNTCCHLGERGDRGFSVAEDPDSSTGKVAKFCKDNVITMHNFQALFISSREKEAKRPITFFIEQDAVYVDKTELYLEDLVPDQYHLYKVGSVSGIRNSADTRVDIFGVNYDWLSLTGISVAFPMDACDVYLSIKFAGEQYGGSPNLQDAVYLDRAIVVRK